jgi:mono/diheme cytochrome c family protein
MKVILLLIIAFAAGVIAYGVSMVRHGFSARATPSWEEVYVARKLRDTAIPTADKALQNPWKATPDVIAAGREHWADHCATCHANDGSGNTPVGQGLYPKAPDMRLAATQDLTDGELYYIIRNGVALTGMPAWGDPNVKRDDESWHLVVFIRHLPALTAEELDQMKKLNPKTEADRAEEQQEEEFLNGGDGDANAGSTSGPSKPVSKRASKRAGQPAKAHNHP